MPEVGHRLLLQVIGMERQAPILVEIQDVPNELTGIPCSGSVVLNRPGPISICVNSISTGAHVDDAFGRARGIRTYEHALDDAVEIALEHAAIHAGPGIALVRVAHQELAGAILLLGRKFPLLTRGETGAAA